MRSDREKLIALLVEAESLCAAFDCFDGAVCEYAGEINGCTAFRADHLIASGVVVREKGEWVLTDARFAEMSCSLCGFTYYGEYDKECMSDFCPHCGSDMRGAVSDG